MGTSEIHFLRSAGGGGGGGGREIKKGGVDIRRELQTNNSAERIIGCRNKRWEHDERLEQNSIQKRLLKEVCWKTNKKTD
jgi:hypothetical protein